MAKFYRKYTVETVERVGGYDVIILTMNEYEQGVGQALNRTRVKVVAEFGNTASNENWDNAKLAASFFNLLNDADQR